MTNTRAHCNNCGGERNHSILHAETTSWSEDKYGISGGDQYETLKCLGCDTVILRHTSWFSEEDGEEVNYFPPAIFRKQPDWFGALRLELQQEEEFVHTLLKEIYVALQNNLPSLAAMGVRSLLEKIMVSKTGDLGAFSANIMEFERLGHVSGLQRGRLEAILEVGHAAIHRDFTPTSQEVITLVDIAEHIVESVFLHDSRIKSVRKRVPLRKKATGGHES
jgi:Domain of unknown function (DUF4145)